MRTRSALLLLAFLPACRADAALSAPDPLPVGATALRVINAAPRAVDVVVDGRLVIAGLVARSVSPRVGVGAGSHTVTLRSAGTAGGTNLTANVTLTTAVGETATVAALPADDSLAAVLTAVFVADAGGAPVTGRSRLRVIHLAPGAPPIDVWRTQPDSSTPARIPLRLTYLAQSPYLESAPGTWVVWVTPADATAPTLASAGSLPLAAGEVGTLVILDAAAGGVQLQRLD